MFSLDSIGDLEDKISVVVVVVVVVDGDEIGSMLGFSVLVLISGELSVDEKLCCKVVRVESPD